MCDKAGNYVRIGVNCGAILVNLIFILKKEIGILQKVAVIGVLSVITNVAIIAITLFVGFDVDIPNKDTISYHGILHLDFSKIKFFADSSYKGFQSLVQGIASVIFCYVNHQLVFPLATDLKNPTKKRLDKVFYRVHITEIIVYIVVGLSGYLLLVEHIDDGRKIDAVVMGSILTTSMSIGKCLMVVSLFFAVPLNLFPARQVMYETFQIEKTNKNHIILSLSLAFSGTVIAIFFDKVTTYFGLLGGTAGVMMAGGIPMICFFKLFEGFKKSKGKRLALVSFIGIVSIFGIFGAVLSVVEAN